MFFVVFANVYVHVLVLAHAYVYTCIYIYVCVEPCGYANVQVSLHMHILVMYYI